ncbi:MAG: universal stress protein [Nitrospiraceae bacterium]|nr:MAG: universal stress protein [Nitrospiraceae bacterium]
MISASPNVKEQGKDRHVLLSLDDSEAAKRAVLYVADFLGGVAGFRVTLLRIIPEPPEDYFSNPGERQDWISASRQKARSDLENYRAVLVQAGFEEDKVAVSTEVRKCSSIASCILDVQRKLGCCTIVMGRRGISKREEFLLGSTSSAVLHKGKNCAVWVIE